MKIIKRNGAEEIFDIKKIVIAVTKADTSQRAEALQIRRLKTLQNM